jgi:hypothetical protein
MRLVGALLAVVALVFAASAAADPPMELPILDVFSDVDPCTGLPTTVTVVGTAFVHEHGSRIVVQAERTITTSGGFVGHGTHSFVDNGQVSVFRLSDILTNASGDRATVRVVFVVDLSTETARVDRFELTCLGP